MLRLQECRDRSPVISSVGVATGTVEDLRGHADRSLEDAFLALTR